MGFFRKIKDSIYSKSFYASIPRTKLLSGIGYFLLLSLLLAIVQSIFSIYVFSSKGQLDINNYVNQIKNTYPSKLTLKIQNGEVTSNVKEPYFIVLPKKIITTYNTSNKEVNLAVVDTSTPYSIRQFNQYKTFAWITKDSIILRDNNGIRVIDLTKVKNATINQTSIDSLFAKFSPWIKWIVPLLAIGIFLILYFVYAVKLIYLFFLAALIWLLLRVIDRPLSYGKSYKISLYAITLGLIVNCVLGILNISGFIFMTTIISLIVAWINISKSPKPTASQSPQPQPEIKQTK